MKKKPRQQKFPHLLGSKWTSVQPVMGWRHYVITNRQDQGGGVIFAQLQSVCDPGVRIWVNARTLKNRDLWQAGWLTLDEEWSQPHSGNA
ncbi:MAG: TIGR02450 family Trp-rich protein [Cyanobacteriota bacterium]|nr:TIGR02450 family Trp-rich protein [Cyanobacteriota bacterium]